MEQGVVYDVRSTLRALGIDSTWARQHDDSGFDYVVTLSRGSSTQSYAVVVKRQPTLAAIAAIDQTRLPLPLLVVGGRMNARSTAAFHDARIQYMDAAGNAYLAFGDVYIDVRGQRPKDLEAESEHRARAGTNLFSARRAQVICLLLTSPSLVQARLKDIADSSGVSVGLAHDTVGQLQRAGFVGASGLRRTDDLLELWAAAYPAGLGATLDLDRFVGDPSPTRVLGTDMWAMPALSGEAAVADLLGRQLTLTLYVDQLDPDLAVVNRWKRDPQMHPNIFVRRRFWNEAVGAGEYDDKGQPLAPWPIVYADLIASGEPRLAEVSKTWLRRHDTRPQ